MTELVLLSLAIAVVGALLARRGLLTCTIHEYERGLLFRRGRFAEVLGPGRYTFVRAWNTVERIDIRPRYAVIPGQEVLSRDGVALRLSIAALYRIVDARQAIMETQSYAGAVHLQLQLAVRSRVASVPIEELLEKRAELSAGIMEDCAPALRAIGLELQEASLRDLTFPGELKKIFTQVVRARQEGLAALEKARGETAALRSLANAAHMLERNPNLLQLRLLQVLGQQPGNTVVLGMQGGATPFPVRNQGGEVLPPPDEIDAS